MKEKLEKKKDMWHDRVALQSNTKLQEMKRREARNACASLLIKDNVAFFHKGLNKHLKEALVLLLRPSPQYIAPYQLLSLICEVGEEIVPQKVEPTLLKLLALIDGEPSTWASVNLDKKLQGCKVEKLNQFLVSNPL